MKIVKILLLLIFISTTYTKAFQHTILIDQPTAGLNNKKTFTVKNEIYAPNGLTSYIGFTPFKRFSLGASIGITNFFGTDSLALNYSSQTFIGLQSKIRLIEEHRNFPAIVLGFDSQGKGEKIKTNSNDTLTIQYPFPELGPYIAISKAFEVFDIFTTGIHGNINYRYWDKNTKWNFSIGSNIDLINYLSIIMEYNFSTYSTKNIGILNSGIRWEITPNFIMDLYFKDILGLNKDLGIAKNKAGRGIRFMYTSEY